MKQILFFGAAFIIFTGAGCVQEKSFVSGEKSIPSPTTSSTVSAASEIKTSLESLKNRVFTEQDFDGFGLKHKDAALRDQRAFYFKVSIHPQKPVYVFRVISFTATTSGRIDIFRDNELIKPLQTIALNPNMWQAENVPLFFTVQDINFDEYGDIGVLVNGGAKWGSYQYWVYNTKTGTFVTSSLTDELAAIAFNDIAFDKTNQRLIVRNLPGVGASRSIYQLTAGHFRLLETREWRNLEKDYQRGDSRNVDLQCEITTTVYADGGVTTTKQVLDEECAVEDAR